MNTNRAVIAFSQAEKIKSSLIAIMHAVELAVALEPPQKRGAERVIRVLLDMVAHETHLTRRLASDGDWEAVYRNIEKAIVMVNSGVVSEAPHHLTRALSGVTSIASRAMAFLKQEGLLVKESPIEKRAKCTNPSTHL